MKVIETTTIVFFSDCCGVSAMTSHVHNFYRISIRLSSKIKTYKKHIVDSSTDKSEIKVYYEKLQNEYSSASAHLR